MKLKLRAAAVRDLDAIFDYGRCKTWRRDGGRAPQKSRDGDGSVACPSGAWRTARHQARTSLDRREHRIFYRIEGKAIVVVRVLHKAMDAERHL